MAGRGQWGIKKSFTALSFEDPICNISLHYWHSKRAYGDTRSWQLSAFINYSSFYYSERASRFSTRVPNQGNHARVRSLGVSRSCGYCPVLFPPTWKPASQRTRVLNVAADSGQRPTRCGESQLLNTTSTRGSGLTRVLCCVVPLQVGLTLGVCKMTI